MSQRRCSHSSGVGDLFGARVEGYVSSPQHSAGDSLRAVCDLAGAAAKGRVLDVGTGPGFVAHALASTASMSVGVDVAPAMLRAALARAGMAGLRNFTAVGADGQDLPFTGGCFDAVVTRTVLHHCLDPALVTAEMARVCRPGGAVVVCDTVAPEDSALNALMNRIEKLRDQAHVRNLTRSELAGLLHEAGLHPDREVQTRVELDFREWTARTATPPERIAELLEIMASPEADVRAAFRIAGGPDDIHFSWPVSVIRAAKP